MRARKIPMGILLLIPCFPMGAAALSRAELDLQRSFEKTVQPFLKTYCLACHNKEKQKGKLDLSAYTTPRAVADDFRQWDVVLDKLKASEMPPEEAKQHPTAKLRRQMIDWIVALRKHEAVRNAGDPGPVLARRLSNAEYDYTIHDLTGVDIRPTREFPVDPANEAGFDNSGESLAMSPVLLKKYLDAARHVAEHLVLKPKGFAFAPHPAITETDRDKYCVKRIIDFYHRQKTDYADYFLAAWRFANRAALGKPSASLAAFAAEEHLSLKYLDLLWSTLHEPQGELGPLAALQAMWRELPVPGSGREIAARHGCEQMRDLVVKLRRRLVPGVKNLAISGIAEGSQPFVLWKDAQYAGNRRCYTGRGPELARIPKFPGERVPPNFPSRLLLLPQNEAQRAAEEAAFDRFCNIFPDAFFVAERGLVFMDEDKESKGRLLSAGFHLMSGYYRDDAPLYDLLLDSAAQRELDQLWEEFHFITLDPLRQYKDYIFFERAEPPRFMQGAEFDFARSEDKDSTSQTKIQLLAEAYMAKAKKNGGKGPALDAIQDYFKTISAQIRKVEQARLAAEPSHLEALQSFAQRAYRRPLTTAERQELLAFYHSLRETEGLPHEEAIRDTMVSILVSPRFCYRVLDSASWLRPGLRPSWVAATSGHRTAKQRSGALRTS